MTIGQSNDQYLSVFTTISEGYLTFVATDDMKIFTTYQTLIKTKWAKCVDGQIWHTSSTDKQVQPAFSLKWTINTALKGFKVATFMSWQLADKSVNGSRDLVTFHH